MKAIILAGGKGSRLRPYTTSFPKPLMPIGDKPILEIVIGQLSGWGIKDIIVTTGHLEELIRVFFQDGKQFGVNISYSKEDRPLGTAGPLNLVRDQLTETFLVMNGDVLTNLDFAKLLEHHRKEKSVATVGLSKRTVHIDFGVVEIDQDGTFAEWKEKPTIDYLVSMGIYLLEPEALDMMVDEVFFTLPELIVKLHENGRKVTGFVHEGYWLDIGRPEDYEKACRDYEDESCDKI